MDIQAGYPESFHIIKMVVSTNGDPAMPKLFLMASLAAAMLMQTSAGRSQSSLHPSLEADTSTTGLAGIPPLPRGKSTIFGGAIRNFDVVRDQFTLNVVGQRPMRILFDERTQVFRDGLKIRLHELGPEDHASVETTLDGDKVFAVSIHVLSHSPEGEYEGRVQNYDPSTGALSIQASSSRDSFKVFVTSSTQFSRVGQKQFTSVASGPSDLTPGSLLSVRFQSRQQDKAVASAITVLAVPGTSFSFSGSIASIDLHSGSMVLVNSTDRKSYQILFNAAAFPEARTLHSGDRVVVTAGYNGSNFTASSIAAN